MVSKKSRKGKKSWRKNIADDEEVKNVKRLHETAEVAALKDFELFQVDTAGDDKTAEKVLTGGRQSSASYTCRKYSLLKAEKEKRKEASLEAFEKKKRKAPHLYGKPERLVKKRRKHSGAILDIWAEDENPEVEAGDWTMPLTVHDLKPGSGHRKQKLKEFAKARRALRVDQAGCSINPDDVEHQVALGEAVAVENSRVIQRVMRPRLIDPDMLAPPVGEMDEMLIRGHMVSVDDEPEAESGSETAIVKTPTTAEGRKTKTVRNKEFRQKQLVKALLNKQKNDQMLKQIDSADLIIKEIEQEEQYLENLRIRRKVDKARKALIHPPRYGKERFKPEALRVLCSEEISGSLRELKPAATLCNDITKGYERVGAIEPTPRNFLHVKKKKGKPYTVGEHSEKMKKIIAEGRALRSRVMDLERQVNSKT